MSCFAAAQHDNERTLDIQCVRVRLRDRCFAAAQHDNRDPSLRSGQALASDEELSLSFEPCLRKKGSNAVL